MKTDSKTAAGIFAMTTALILIMLTSSLFAQERLTGAKKAVVDEFHKQMADKHIVGGALVISQPGKVLLETHYGMANKEKSMPAGENTIYAWGSITKTMTCIGIMQLHIRGKLDINDPVVKYLPAFGKVNNEFGDNSQITLKMLMSHTSGLQNGSFIIPLSWHKPWPRWEQLEPVFNYINIEHRPGTKYSYSNLGLLLLGRIIEVITLDDYEVYVDKNILKPLEMYSSYFDATPYHLIDKKAQGYYPYEEGQTRKLYDPDIDQGVTTSNGGLKSSIADFKKYVQFLLGSDDPGTAKLYDGILPRDVLESMWEPVHPFPKPEDGSIGLAFHIYTELGHRFIGHTGSANGFISQFMIHPETKTAFFAVGNTANSGAVNNHMKAFIDKRLSDLQKEQ